MRRRLEGAGRRQSAVGVPRGEDLGPRTRPPPPTRGRTARVTATAPPAGALHRVPSVGCAGSRTSVRAASAPREEPGRAGGGGRAAGAGARTAAPRYRRPAWPHGPLTSVVQPTLGRRGGPRADRVRHRLRGSGVRPHAVRPPGGGRSRTAPANAVGAAGHPGDVPAHPNQNNAVRPAGAGTASGHRAWKPPSPGPSRPPEACLPEPSHRSLSPAGARPVPGPARAPEARPGAGGPSAAPPRAERSPVRPPAGRSLRGRRPRPRLAGERTG
ncbi:hypothetical protein SNARM312S_06948 [Streptomyces narbonensis]